MKVEETKRYFQKCSISEDLFSMYAISGNLVFDISEWDGREKGRHGSGNKGIQYKREKWVETPEWW